MGAKGMIFGPTPGEKNLILRNVFYLCVSGRLVKQGALALQYLPKAGHSRGIDKTRHMHASHTPSKERVTLASRLSTRNGCAQARSDQPNWIDGIYEEFKEHISMKMRAQYFACFTGKYRGPFFERKISVSQRPRASLR
jgi:hypothetical protein